MTAYSTQGSRFGYKKQSAFGTAETSGFVDFRLEGTPTQKTPVVDMVQPASVFANENKTEKPIPIYQAHDDAFKCTWLPRQASAEDGVSQTQAAAEAGGLDATLSTNDTTVATYASTTSFVATADVFAVGQGCVAELSNGTWWPFVVGDYNTGNTIVPAMAIPSATEKGKALNSCLTIVPGASGEITATDLLTIHTYLKSLDSTDQVFIINQDCAVTSWDDIVIEAGQPLKLGATFGATSITQSNGASALGTNSFSDYDGGVRLCDDVYVQFAAASASAGIAAAYQHLIKATIKLGVSAKQIPGFGSTSCSNSVQGWMKVVSPATITLDMLWDVARMDDFNGANASKFISITRPGAAETDCCWNFTMPNAHQTAFSYEPFSNAEHRISVTYTADVAGYNSTTATAALGNQPWYLLFGARG
jgi:hypothetical protein